MNFGNVRSPLLGSHLQLSEGDCSTTAQKEVIGDAIEKHLKNTDNGNLCGTECLHFTHGGTWNGYLLIGPYGYFDDKKECGANLDYKQCTNGVKNDFGKIKRWEA